MILVGLDDTDTIDTRGTNQLARQLVSVLEPDWECVWIVRHQLFADPRVPFTSKNGSASIKLKPITGRPTSELWDICERVMRDDFIPGSDPGLCIATEVPEEIIAYARRCQSELMTQQVARELAEKHSIPLKGLGGTEDGVIGALAAIGLAETKNDGRVVKLGTWQDDLTGVQPIEAVHARGVEVWEWPTNRLVQRGTVDLGKKLRPNLRDGRFVLFVESRSSESLSAADYLALKIL